MKKNDTGDTRKQNKLVNWTVIVLVGMTLFIIAHSLVECYVGRYAIDHNQQIEADSSAVFQNFKLTNSLHTHR